MLPRLIVADAIRDHAGVRGDAVLVAGHRIVEVGRSGDLRSADLPRRAFPGTTIVPGLRDAHLHPVGLAAALLRLSLKEATDFDAVADMLRDAAGGSRLAQPLTALRLDDESLAEGRLPDRDFLDRIAPDRPALLVRYCAHVAVANSMALSLAGIGDDTPDPVGGRMDRDEQGHLTGVLRETAIEPVSAALRSLAAAVTPDDLVRSAYGLASVGLTGIGAMVSTDAGYWAWRSRTRCGDRGGAATSDSDGCPGRRRRSC